MVMKKIAKYVGAGLIGLTALVIAPRSMYIVHETEQAVVTELGAIKYEVREPGLHFKFPWRSVHVLEDRIFCRADEPDRAVTHDQSFLNVSNFSCIQIENPAQFYVSLRTEENAQNTLDDRIGAALKGSISEQDLMETVMTSARDIDLEELGLDQDIDYHHVQVGREQVMRDATQAANSTIQNEFGVNVVDIRINTVTLPSITRDSLHDRMIQERRRISAQYLAQGNEEHARILAETGREVARITSEAERTAQTTRGEAEAYATTTRAEADRAGQRYMEFEANLRILDAMSDQGASIVVTEDSPVYRIFQGQ